MRVSVCVCDARLIRDLHVREIVPVHDRPRFIMMSLAELLNPLTGLLEHVVRHGDHQPHVRVIIEALRESSGNVSGKRERSYKQADFSNGFPFTLFRDTIEQRQINLAYALLFGLITLRTRGRHAF